MERLTPCLLLHFVYVGTDRRVVTSSFRFCRRHLDYLNLFVVFCKSAMAFAIEPSMRAEPKSTQFFLPTFSGHVLPSQKP
jgi:hypothetical protein